MTLFNSRFLLTTAIAFALSAGAAMVETPARASSSACAHKKHGKKGGKGAKGAKKVTAASILKWRHSGMEDDEIIARATDSGYMMSAADRAKLTKAKVPKALIAALPKSSEAQAISNPPASPSPAKKVKAIDLGNLTKPEDIDFESVPPPKGMPTKYVTGGSKKVASVAVQTETARPESASRMESAAPGKAAPGKRAAKDPVATAEKREHRAVYTASE